MFKFTLAGVKSAFASGLNVPIGMAFDGSGNLYVTVACGSETPCDAIYQFTPAGVGTAFVSEGGLIDSTRFLDLAFDDTGNLFASLGGPNSGGAIKKFTPAGVESTFSATGGSVLGLAFDGSGNLFAAESVTGTIAKYTSDGKTQHLCLQSKCSFRPRL